MLKYLPLFLFCIIHLTLAVTFALAVSLEHVTYFLPYISDSGTYSPESCIFGMMLNFMAVLISVTMYVRYLQIKEIVFKHNLPQKCSCLNSIAIFIGLTGCFGCSLVANFQETTMLVIHWIGAISLFLSGAVYQCLQTVISLKIRSIFGSYKINVIRIGLSVASTVSVLIFLPTGLYALSVFQGEDITKWKEEDGGFGIHILSTVTEWICASCTMLYLLSFMWDFNYVNVKHPEVVVYDNVPVTLDLN